MESSALAWWHADTVKFLGLMFQRLFTSGTFRILILVLMVFELKENIVDVETAFLCGNIEEVIFMECPPGMTDAEADDVLAWNNASMVLYRQQDSIIRRLLKFCEKLVSMVEKLIRVFSGNDMKRKLFLWQDMWMTS